MQASTCSYRRAVSHVLHLGTKAQHICAAVSSERHVWSTPKVISGSFTFDVGDDRIRRYKDSSSAPTLDTRIHHEPGACRQPRRSRRRAGDAELSWRRCAAAVTRATLRQRVEQLDVLSRRLMHFESTETNRPASARRVRRTAAGVSAGDLAASVQLRHPVHPAGWRAGRLHGQARPAVSGDRRQVPVQCGRETGPRGAADERLRTRHRPPRGSRGRQVRGTGRRHLQLRAAVRSQRCPLPAAALLGSSDQAMGKARIRRVVQVRPFRHIPVPAARSAKPCAACTWPLSAWNWSPRCSVRATYSAALLETTRRSESQLWQLGRGHAALSYRAAQLFDSRPRSASPFGSAVRSPIVRQEIREHPLRPGD